MPTCLRIAVISDLHYSDHPNRSLPQRRGDIADQLFEQAVERLNNELKPDLTILCGDLVDSPQTPELLPHLVDIARTLTMPWLAIPGNHDPEPDVFYQYFPRPLDTFDLKGFWFMPFLDPEEPRWNARRTPEDIERLRQTALSAAGPCIMVQHVPFAQPHTQPYTYTNIEDILDAIQNTNVSLAISGHNHDGADPVFYRGLQSFVAPALCEAPFTFVVLDLNQAGRITAVQPVNVKPNL